MRCAAGDTPAFAAAGAVPVRRPRAARKMPARPRRAWRASAADDSALMRRAVALALRAAGQTRPNPVVGCVLVSPAGEILSEGFHARAGELHAEASALASAAARGISVAGATAYVSLEPCSHYGRTPPCADALLAARVARVVVGVGDPDPRVSGRGIARLRAGGVVVDEGVEGELCEKVNEGFLWRVRNGRPFGTLKYATSLDGKIATTTGSSRWVTGSGARKRVHQMRSAADAVVVGGATVRKDDPRLSVRGVEVPAGGLAPMRVVLSQGLDIPADARMWGVAGDGEAAGEAVVLVDSKHGRPGRVAELRARGVVVEEVAGMRPGDAMEFLHGRDCMNVLWECGGTLAREAIADGAVQKVAAFVALKIVGGAGAPTPVDGDGLCLDMSDALTLKDTSVDVLEGGDVLIQGYLRKDEGE